MQKHNRKVEKFASDVNNFLKESAILLKLALAKRQMTGLLSTVLWGNWCVCVWESTCWDLPKWGSPGETELSAEVKVYAGQQIMRKL